MGRGTTYAVTVNGQRFTRTSPRPYAFAIVAQADVAWARAQAADHGAHARVERANFDYYRSERFLGDPRFVRDGEQERRAAERARCLALTFEQYQAETTAARLAEIEARVARGGFRPVVVGWSQSLANAEKAAANWRKPGFRSVLVVPVGGAVQVEG